jgi:small-conductance mechanosensitive channel
MIVPVLAMALLMLIGIILPGPVRIAVAVATTVAALILLARSLNVHGFSGVAFICSVTVAIGAWSRTAIDRFPRTARRICGIFGLVLAFGTGTYMSVVSNQSDLAILVVALGMGITLSAGWIEMAQGRKANEHG